MNTNTFSLSASPGFTAWLAEQRASLAFTTYQAGKLFFLGLGPDGRLRVCERSFARCMGLGTGPGGTLWMASLHQLWRFENFLDPGETHQGCDAVYVPVTGHTTGELDVHDIQTTAGGQPVFVATRFNCLAGLSARGSFAPLWRPPFIDRLVAEDRCHLNGLAMGPEGPAYATCVGPANLADGWRAHRRDGGLLLRVADGGTVADGLSMPHSPRMRDGTLWLLQSGAGEFGHVDGVGRFEAVCPLPGFPRGLAFLGAHAVIGVSRARTGRTFEGLPLGERLAREGEEPRCGVAIVDLATGALAHWLSIEGVVDELYDVAVLPGVRCPMGLGFKTDEIQYFIRPS